MQKADIGCHLAILETTLVERLLEMDHMLKAGKQVLLVVLHMQKAIRLLQQVRHRMLKAISQTLSVHIHMLKDE